MFRISAAEVVLFVVLLFLGYTSLPAFFEWPIIIVTLVAAAFLAYYLWRYVRLFFTRVILVRGTGVAILTKDFQTAPLTPNKEVWKIVSKLRNFHVTVVFWSFTRDFDQSVMQHFGLSKIFDKCFYPSDFLTADPSEYLKKICSALGVSPKKVVLIDSDDKALQAASSLGMAAIKYSNSVKLAEDLRAKGL